MKLRRDRNRIATQRRQHRRSISLFNRYQTFKVVMRYGRRKPVHWWG